MDELGNVMCPMDRHQMRLWVPSTEEKSLDKKVKSITTVQGKGFAIQPLKRSRHVLCSYFKVSLQLWHPKSQQFWCKSSSRFCLTKKKNILQPCREHVFCGSNKERQFFKHLLQVTHKWNLHFREAERKVKKSDNILAKCAFKILSVAGPLNENVKLGSDSWSKDYGIQTVLNQISWRERKGIKTQVIISDCTLHMLLFPFGLIPCIHDLKRLHCSCVFQSSTNKY